jgi:nucleoside-diphosphate-sugar epimerase
MRVVIVGGNGNIGTAIVDLLLRQGHDVTVVSRGNRPVRSDVRPLIGDRADREWFERIMREGDFEAAVDMVAYTREDAESSLRAFAGVRQLIHTSTIVVYGNGRDFLFTTEDHPMDAVDDYGGQKAQIDRLYLEAHARDGFPVTLLRPSWAFGGPGFGIVRQVGGGAGWIDRIRSGKPLVVCADGMVLVRFLHVEDAALAYAGALAHPETIGQAYNLVDPRMVTWADYHRAAMEAVGREVDLVGVALDDLRAWDVPGLALCETVTSHHWVHDDAKIRRDIPEFLPRVALADGLARSFEHGIEGAFSRAVDDEWEDAVIAAQRRVRGRGE